MSTVPFYLVETIANAIAAHEGRKTALDDWDLAEYIALVIENYQESHSND